MDGLQVAGFEFYSNFDSANLAKVELVPPNESVVTPASNTGKSVVPEIPDIEFNIWTKPDCCGTEFENGNRTWFYFGMKASASALLVKLNLVDINRQAKMYSQGMAPVYRILPGKPHWERIRDKASYSTQDNIFTLSFKFKTPDSQSVTYFAFTYPFSYLELQSYLVNLDAKYFNAVPNSKDDIYYTREVVCKSLEGRRVDLITISSYHNISTEHEVRLKNLFPEDNIPRPYRFIGKKVIFVSARVHPGETPSSFVFNGLLNLLLNREDPIAVILRKQYVFKLIPFLNPDGVARGHYRTDTRGVNLNRMYLKPLISLHPSVYAARSLIRYYHYGYEKEDDETDSLKASDSSKSSSVENSLSQNNDNKLSKQVSHMTLEESENNKNISSSEPWCCKCKTNIVKLEETMPGISTIIPTFNHNKPLATGEDVCRNCGSTITEAKDQISQQNNVSQNILSHDQSNLSHGENVIPCGENNIPHGDSNLNQSGLFLYMDMHGHASKKGIFMYGNHFQDVEENVECMLLPKIMSLNNHNFHFAACNFTERNMYLKDRRDGMSREGSGRVAVLKLTGLIRSYTLECNYNTGRLVNVLPPTIKESNKTGHTLSAPPKYTPQVYEEVGKALAYSLLDLTAQNPYTRLTNSEFHSLNGLRDWLRIYCANELGETQTTPARIKLRHSASLRSQGKPVRAVVIKARSIGSKVPPKKMASKVARSTNIPIDRKENVSFHSEEAIVPQPSCSHSSPGNFTTSRVRSGLQPNKSMNVRSRYKKDLGVRKSNVTSDKTAKPYAHINKSLPNSAVRPKLKVDLSQKLKNVKETPKEAHPESEECELDRIKLHEICFVKDGEGGKKVIAKYKNIAEDTRIREDNLIVSWDSSNSNPQVFSHKSLLPKPSVAEAGPSKTTQGAFRVHNFAKSSSFAKNKRSKRTLRRLTGATDPCGKIDKLKKRKKLQNKLS